MNAGISAIREDGTYKTINDKYFPFDIYGGRPAVASTITLQDILGVGRWLNGRYYLAYEGFITAAGLYFLIVLAITFVFRRAERRYLRHLTRRTT